MIKIIRQIIYASFFAFSPSVNKTTMKKSISIIILAQIIFASCSITEVNTPRILNAEGEQLDTTITVSDTLLLSFGYFGDEEGLYIDQFPGHAEACSFLNRQWEERILQYIPDSAFTGRDSLVIITLRGSDGASAATDTAVFKIRVDIDPATLKKLCGSWIWTGSCGGFTGGCWYPAEGEVQKIVITSDRTFSSYLNDSLVGKQSFTLTETHMNGDYEVTGLVFGTNPAQWFWFAGEELCLQGGDFVETYERQ